MPRIRYTMTVRDGCLPTLHNTLCMVLADATQDSLGGTCRRYTRLSARCLPTIHNSLPTLHKTLWAVCQHYTRLSACGRYCLLTLYTVLADATQDSLGGLPTLHMTLWLTLLFADALHALATLHKTLCAVLPTLHNTPYGVC